MLLAVALADALQPRVDRSIVELDAVVRGGRELVAVKVLDNALLPTSADGLFTSFAPSVYFNVDHVVLLRLGLGVEVGAGVEDEVAWLHFLFLELDGQSVKLVGLVPPVEVEAKIFS